jgi:dTDP-4-dehydrorhamnose 3,5-epimerase
VVTVRPLRVPDVQVLEPRTFRDERGYFLEAWNSRTLAAAGFHANFVQDNLVHSVHGVIRGLHYQMARPQGKLVRCLNGEIFDVAVDLRTASSTFGAWVGQLLSEQNAFSLWVPPGFAHGYCVLSESAMVYYKCTEFYEPAEERLLLWNDPAVGIDWPFDRMRARLLNARDAAAPPLSIAETYP